MKMKRSVYTCFFAFVSIAVLLLSGGCSSDNSTATTQTAQTQNAQTQTAQTQNAPEVAVEETTSTTAGITQTTSVAPETTAASTQAPSGSEPTRAPREDKVVQWTEPALEALVRAKLEKPDGDIMQSELDDIWGIELIGDSHLYFNGKGGYSMYTNPETYFVDDAASLKSLQNPAGILFELEEGAETSLKEGTYWVKGQAYTRGAITSLDDLANFRNVKFLNIYKNDLKDLKGLASLEDLTTLNLVENSIVDIGPLASLEKIEVLDLTSNQITDASPLSNLTELKRLALLDNQINNIDGFSALTNLTSLRLSHNPIESLDELAPLSHLRSLLISNTRVQDISALYGKTSLSFLDMSHLDAAQIDLEPLVTNTPNLTALMISQNKAELLNIRSIAELKQLMALVILLGDQSAKIPDSEIDWLREQLPGCMIGGVRPE